MSRYYRRKLLEAAYLLMTDGDLDLRLALVAGCLKQINDDDIPPTVRDAFERVRDPLITKPIVVDGRVVPRDLSEAESRAAALGILDLLVAELGRL